MTPSEAGGASQEVPLSALLTIDAICQEFEDLWKVRAAPKIESYLAKAPPGAEALLLRELLALERHYLIVQGGAPDVGLYKARFAAHAQIVEEILRSTRSGGG